MESHNQIFSGRELLKLLFSIILSSVFLISCKSKKYNKDLSLTFHYNGDSLTVENFLKCKDGAYLYFNIESSDINEILFNEEIIDKIILTYKNERFLALPEKIFSSAPRNSKLSYVVGQESKKLDYFKNEKGKWFFVSENNSPSIILKPIIENCDSCSWEKSNSN